MNVLVPVTVTFVYTPLKVANFCVEHDRGSQFMHISCITGVSTWDSHHEYMGSQFHRHAEMAI